MKLEEVRKQIDAVDPKIRELLMERLDCSYEVAKAKTESKDLTIYRADREEEILSRLGENVPEDRRAGYLAVVRKIMETSRMYQYGLIYDWVPGLFDPLIENITIPNPAKSVRLRLTRPDRPNAMSSILSMVGDYGYNMKTMTLISENHADRSVSFELEILGDINNEHMKKLLYQLSMESKDFTILEVF
jgi:chorismate mutase